MVSTAVGNDELDTRFMIDKLVSALEEVYEVIDGGIGDTDAHVFMIIERVLEDYRSKYGKNAPRGSGRE